MSTNLKSLYLLPALFATLSPSLFAAGMVPETPC